MTLLCVCDTCCLVPLRRQQSTFVDAERWRDPQWRKRWWRCEDRRGRWWFGDTTDILARHVERLLAFRAAEELPTAEEVEEGGSR